MGQVDPKMSDGSHSIARLHSEEALGVNAATKRTSNTSTEVQTGWGGRSTPPPKKM